jgi:hypothetical protein
MTPGNTDRDIGDGKDDQCAKVAEAFMRNTEKTMELSKIKNSTWSCSVLGISEDKISASYSGFLRR